MRAVSGPASKFVDGVQRLVVGVREGDGIDRVLPIAPAS